MTITKASTTKMYCANSGKWCEFANLQGFCTLTACCQRVVYNTRAEYKHRTDRPQGEWKLLKPQEDGLWGDIYIRLPLAGTIYTDSPSVEYALVRRGKWVVAGNTTHYYICSVCGKPGDGFDNYCRSCGSRMGGAEE